jgi:hypothetical protein
VWRDPFFRAGVTKDHGAAAATSFTSFIRRVRSHLPRSSFGLSLEQHLQHNQARSAGPVPPTLGQPITAFPPGFEDERFFIRGQAVTAR